LNSGNEVKLNSIICNAGALSNSLTLTEEGVETTFAAHLLFGTYLFVSLALSALENTAGSRVVVVSSGGMYNTPFPEWDIATGKKGKYDGQLAYAYAKRGQVLLCEQWTSMHPGVKFVSCHPGWVDTPGVESAYGSNKKYLEPLRTLWEGSEGIVWLAVAPIDEIQSGEFYLDRTPRVKHIAGPFFTEGTFTKNSPAEVKSMMDNLEVWCNGNIRLQSIDLKSYSPWNDISSLSAVHTVPEEKGMFSSFGQFASTSQFFLYGKKHCTKTGWEAASMNYPIPDILESEGLQLTANVYIVTG
jgi:dehydrogenase/reductase SDR family protein 12